MGLREEIRLSREQIRLSQEIRLSREQHADPRGFIREVSLRAERFTQEVVAELRALSGAGRPAGGESRADQALLRVLDRVGPGPSSA